MKAHLWQIFMVFVVMAAYLAINAGALFWHKFSKGNNRRKDFIKILSEAIPRKNFIRYRDDDLSRDIIECSYEDLKININFSTDIFARKWRGIYWGMYWGVRISFTCLLKTSGAFKIFKNKKIIGHPQSASKFERRYWIESDSEETENKIMSNSDLCRHAKNMLELFDIELSSGELSATSTRDIDFHHSEPEALLSHLNAFVAFADGIKVDSHFS